MNTNTYSVTNITWNKIKTTRYRVPSALGYLGQVTTTLWNTIILMCYLKKRRRSIVMTSQRSDLNTRWVHRSKWIESFTIIKFYVTCILWGKSHGSVISLSVLLVQYRCEKIGSGHLRKSPNVKMRKFCSLFLLLSTRELVVFLCSSYIICKDITY